MTKIVASISRRLSLRYLFSGMPNTPILTVGGADLVAKLELKFRLEGLELFCWASLTKYKVAPSNDTLKNLLSMAYRGIFRTYCNLKVTKTLLGLLIALSIFIIPKGLDDDS